MVTIQCASWPPFIKPPKVAFQGQHAVIIIMVTVWVSGEDLYVYCSGSTALNHSG